MSVDHQRLLEVWGGAALMLAGLLDVFLTILYARIGYSVIASWIARAMRCCFRLLARISPRHGGRILSFCGPVIMVLLVGAWSSVLVLGTALILHPELGRGAIARSGDTNTDFTSALYAASTTLSIANSGNFNPHTPAMRLLFVADAIIGASVVSLVLTYLMQVYTALQERNALALKVHLATGQTGDAAALICAIGPDGQFESGFSSLAEIAGETARMKESHHFYPVIAYFRFKDPLYAVSRFAFVLLDAHTLMHTALHEQKLDWARRAAAPVQAGEAARLLVKTLSNHFAVKSVEQSRRDTTRHPLWRRRYFAALEQLRAAGIPTTENPEAGVEAYVKARADWEPHIDAVAPLMGYTMAEIDLIGATLAQTP